MLKFGKDIGISPISDIKIDMFPDKAIRSFYKINDILYKNAKCYISPSMGEKILVELSARTIDFKEIEVGSSSRHKRRTIGYLKKEVSSTKTIFKDIYMEQRRRILRIENSEIPIINVLER